MPIHPHMLVFVLIGWIALAASHGRAAEPRQKIVIGVVPAADELSAERVQVALASYFTDDRDRLELVSLPAERTLLDRFEWADAAVQSQRVQAVFWLDWIPERGRVLYLMDPVTRKTWSRTIPLSSDPDIVLENLAIMIRALVDALPERDPPGMDPVERSQTPPATSAPPTPASSDPPPERSPRSRTRTRPHVGAHLAYLGGSFARDSPWHSGVGARIALHLPRGPFMGLGGGWLTGSSVDTAVPVRLHRGAIDARIGYRFATPTVIEPELDLTATAEIVTWDARDQASWTGQDGSAWRIALSPGFGVGWRVWGELRLHVHTQLDFWLLNIDLVTDRGDQRENELRAFPIGGSLNLGLAHEF